MNEKRRELLERYERAVRDTELYVNKAGEPALISRAKKALRHPAKVLRVGAYRAGLIKEPDVHADMFFGARLRLPLWDEDAMLTYYTGSFGLAETRLVRYLIRTLDESSIFYDIGANLGLYSALAGSLGAEVHSFEPSPQTAAYITANAGAHEVVNACALSDRPGELSFYEVPEGGKTGMSSFFLDIAARGGGAVREIKVPVTTLDEYAASHAAPTFVKMDAMNADSLIVLGGKKLLGEGGPLLAARIYNTVEAAERTERTLRTLSEYGYRPYSIGTEEELVPETIVIPELKFATTFIFKKS